MKAKQFVVTINNDNVKIYKPENSEVWTMMVTTAIVTDRVIWENMKLENVLYFLANAKQFNYKISKQIITI